MSSIRTFPTGSAAVTLAARDVRLANQIAREAGQLLAAAIGSFESGEEVYTEGHALPPAHERLASRLAQLGIRSLERGELLEQLRERIPDRGVTPERTAALQQALQSLPSGAGGGMNLADAARQQNQQYLDARQRAAIALQEAANLQSEGAALIIMLRKAHSEVKKQIIQNMAR